MLRSTCRVTLSALLLVWLNTQAIGQDYIWERLSCLMETYAHGEVGISEGPIYAGTGFNLSVLDEDDDDDDSTDGSTVAAAAGGGGNVGSGITDSLYIASGTMDINPDGQVLFGTAISSGGNVEIQTGTLVGPNGQNPPIGYVYAYQQYNQDAYYRLDRISQSTGATPINGYIDFTALERSGVFGAFQVYVDHGSNLDTNGDPQSWAPIFSATGATGSGVNLSRYVIEDWGPPYGPQYVWESGQADESPFESDDVRYDFDYQSIAVGDVVRFRIMFWGLIELNADDNRNLSDQANYGIDFAVTTTPAP